jgi:predicted RNA-binding protein YlxR (DUF448 family)
LGLSVRKCTGCGARRPKSEMVRVGGDGWTVTRAEVKLSGRGAYVCPKAECIEKARGRCGIERTLGSKVPPQVYEKIEQLSKESH